MASLQLKTTISSAYLQQALFKGSFYGLGAIILLIGAIFICPESTMSYSGVWIFLAAACLIARGMIPYRRLWLLQLHPNTLYIEDNKLLYVEGKKITFECNLDAIDYSKWTERGIVLVLKNQNEKIFPHFNKRSFERLLEHIT
jgi:uncharacterized membrane protein YbhN (UPF0104 family)